MTVNIDNDRLEELMAISKWDGSSIEVTTKDKEYKVMEVSRVIEHKLANTHRIQNETEFMSLLNGIMLTGQTVPIILYRGKLVDGRHRVLALKKLGIKWVKFIELENNLTLAEVKLRIHGTDLGRNDTPLQKAAKGYIDFYENSTDEDSQEEFALANGTTKGSINKMKLFAEHFGIAQVKEAYRTGIVKIGSQRYTSISALYKLALEARRKAKETSSGDNTVGLTGKPVSVDVNNILNVAKKMENEDVYYLMGALESEIKKRMEK